MDQGTNNTKIFVSLAGDFTMISWETEGGRGEGRERSREREGEGKGRRGEGRER